MLAQKEAPEEDPAELHKLRRRWKRKRNFSAVGAKRLWVSGRGPRSVAEIRAANKAMMASMRERSMVEEKRLAALGMAQQEQRRQQILRRQEEQKMRILRGPPGGKRELRGGGGKSER